MIVEIVDSMRAKEQQLIAVDNIGAGIGEYVLVAQGSAARIGCDMADAPIDAAIVGIIDDNPALGHLNVYGFNVLGTLRRLDAIYQQTPFEEIIITCNDIGNGKIRRLREFQKKYNVRLVTFVRELKEFSE